MGNAVVIRWLDGPEDKDYPAAPSYLGLLFQDAQAQNLVKQLQAAPLTHFKAKDIVRASGLALLGTTNAHVVKDLKKLQDGGALSPILLVREPTLGKVVVADGFHRICAVYSLSEDEWIPCKIV
jgi:hypothetical protein